MTQGFIKDVVATIQAHRDRVIDAPIIDRTRFPDDDFPQPTPDAIDRSIRRLQHHEAGYDEVAASFADDHSPRLLKELMIFRALGPFRYALPLSTQSFIDQYAEEDRYRLHRSETVLHWPQSVFRIEFLGEPIELDVWDGCIAATFLRRQYFLERANAHVAPAAGDIAIDCGACLGDTALAFAAAVGPAGRVLSYEPIPAIQNVFTMNMARNPRLGSRVELVDRAVSNQSGQIVKMIESDAGSCVATEGTLECRTLTIDDLAAEKNLPRVDFIKMDVEGQEENALLGAASTIARHRPKLAISAYHRADDFLRLPQLIRRLNPDYQLYLEHYTNHKEETVLYAR